MTQTHPNARLTSRAFLICLASFLFSFGKANAQVSDGAVVGSLETDIDTTDANPVDRRIPWFTNDELLDRLNSLPAGCIRPQLTSAVRAYIHTYGVRKREKCEGMLGRRVLYFPMFEKYLKAAGMPSELKYLSVTESALNPTIVSSAGAVGLWQFMPATGKEYGLDITNAIDERCDPNKSTQAAIKYLQKLYIQFGSWELALAAYNSGAGRVAGAIKRAHSYNFWKIQNYLPQETRNYVPAFIAAMYICHYWDAHNLQPEPTEMEAQITSSTLVYETMTFSEISEATGVDYQMLKLLNPQYRQNYIPQSGEGHYLTIPTRVLPAFLKFMNGRGGRQYLTDQPVIFGHTGGSLCFANKYLMTKYTPNAGETLESVAREFGTDVEYLKIWNNSPFGGIVIGQEMKIYQPYSVLERQNIKVEGSKVAAESGKPGKKPADKITVGKPSDKPSGKPVESPSKQPVVPSAAPKAATFHTVQRGESLDDIALQHGMTGKQLMDLNPKIDLKIGARLRLK